MPKPPVKLWRHLDFLKLWAAEAVSSTGSKITFLALPLTASEILSATPMQMGLLAAAGSLPGFLFGLFAGVWVDRHKRRPLLTFVDLGRGLLLLLIPLAAWAGWLQIHLMYVVLFLTSALGLFFSVEAYLPSLVPREQLIDANSKLALSGTAAEVAGPGLGGWLVQALTAPIAILFDGVSFLFSSLLLSLIHSPEPPPAPPQGKENIWQAIYTGVTLILHNPLLRAITGSTGTMSFFNAALEAVYLLYMTRRLGLEPAIVGLIFGAGSAGFLLGSLLPERLVKHFGLGATTIIGFIIPALSDFVLPLVGGPKVLNVSLLIVAQILFGLGLTLYNVGQTSIRQTITPNYLLGRMNATLNFAVAALIPLGALAGGVLGEVLGLRTTLLLAAGGELLAVGWLLFSPLRTLEHISQLSPYKVAPGEARLH